MQPEDTVRLEPSSLNPPSGLDALLQDLGAGENGFGGTPVYQGEMTLIDFLQHSIDMRDAAKVGADRVPQTLFWVIDAKDRAIGIVRMRHYLNDRLRDHGGHIGYFIKRDQRGRGYGRAALRQALAELRALGEERALLTVDLDNHASIRVIEAHGGQLESTDRDETGNAVVRYWIDLATERGE